MDTCTATQRNIEISDSPIRDWRGVMSTDSYNINVALTWAVGVVREGHLEGVSVVEDVEAGGRVVLQVERLQPRVVRRVAGHDVDGRLAGPVGDGEVIGPFVGSYKKKKKMTHREEYSLWLEYWNVLKCVGFFLFFLFHSLDKLRIWGWWRA